MKKIMKNIMSLTIIASMFASQNYGIKVYALENDEISIDTKIEIIEDNAELENISDEIEAIVIDDQKIAKLDEEDVNELLDDGVCILDYSSSAKEINEFFGESICENEDAVVGFKIEKNGEDIISQSIAIEAVDTNGNVIESGEEYDELIENLEISDEDYDVLIDVEDNDDYLNQLSEKQIALLQGSNSLGKEICEVSRTTYYYGKSGLSNATKALKKGEAAGSGWNKMGFSTISLSAYSAGGKSKKETKVSMRVKDLHFVGLFDYYDVANRTGSEYVYITVKDHKKVKSYQ